MKILRYLAPLAFFFTGPALAHHPMAGEPLTTFSQGLLSGIGHPVLGIDHLFFVVAVGIVASLTRLPLRMPLIYIVCMLAGVFVINAGLVLPQAELLVALSLVVLGAAVVSGAALKVHTIGIAFAVGGIVHGYALGGTIAETESVSMAVLTGYLAGLCLIQWAVSCAAGYFTTQRLRVVDSTALRPRLAGAICLGVGIVFVVEHAETALLSLI